VKNFVGRLELIRRMLELMYAYRAELPPIFVKPIGKTGINRGAGRERLL